MYRRRLLVFRKALEWKTKTIEFPTTTNTHVVPYTYVLCAPIGIYIIYTVHACLQYTFS